VLGAAVLSTDDRGFRLELFDRIKAPAVEVAGAA
jgi:hypothetical protein